MIFIVKNCCQAKNFWFFYSRLRFVKEVWSVTKHPAICARRIDTDSKLLIYLMYELQTEWLIIYICLRKAVIDECVEFIRWKRVECVIVSHLDFVIDFKLLSFRIEKVCHFPKNFDLEIGENITVFKHGVAQNFSVSGLWCTRPCSSFEQMWRFY